MHGAGSERRCAICEKYRARAGGPVWGLHPIFPGRGISRSVVVTGCRSTTASDHGAETRPPSAGIVDRALNPRLLLVLAVLGLLSVGGIVVGLLGQRTTSDRNAEPVVDAPRSPFEGAVLPPRVRAPDFSLANQDGETVTMSALRGRPVIVTFLYTDCDESCPPQAQLIKGALDELGHDVPALAVTVDPPNDTAEKARGFLLEQRLMGRLDFVLGSRRELTPVWKGFAIQPQLDDAEHQARIMLIDRDGFQRVSFTVDHATPRRIAHDLRMLEGA